MHTLHLYTRGTRGLRISHKDHITRERDKPHGYRYGPQPRGRTTPSSSWESATAMEMAVKSMAMTYGGNSPLRQGSGTEFCPPKHGFGVGGGYGTFRGCMATLP